ncbi:MAG: CoA ester lyase, partial [Methylobacteriaceae bacterium]|nr:CoA ester lyase [Methylobacteriaceae bacterium]
MILRPRRSALYMPGSNARALEKAKSLPADVLIFDLEDAVSPDAKIAARDQVVAAVRQGGYGNREIAVRINAPDTPWGKDDLTAVAEAGPDAVLVPKISTPGDIMMAARGLREAATPDRTRLWAMMETPLAILNADSIARTGADPASRLSLLVMGTNDIAKDTRARLTPGRPAMLAYLSICVAAARAHGCDVIDGVYNDIKDLDGFAAECRQGLEFGFDGKTLIHPSQIDICNRTFAPTEAEVAQARAIIAAFDLPENQAKGVLQIEGKMVELL